MFCLLELFWIVFESSRGEASFCGDSEEFVAVNRMGEYCFLMLFVVLEYVESRITC